MKEMTSEESLSALNTYRRREQFGKSELKNFIGMHKVGEGRGQKSKHALSMLIISLLIQNSQT